MISTIQKHISVQSDEFEWNHIMQNTKKIAQKHTKNYATIFMYKCDLNKGLNIMPEMCIKNTLGNYCFFFILHLLHGTTLKIEKYMEKK